MNDELRAKLSDQQERIKQTADWLLELMRNDFEEAYEAGNKERIQQLDFYWRGVKDLKQKLLEAIEYEKRETNFSGKKGSE